MDKFTAEDIKEQLVYVNEDKNRARHIAGVEEGRAYYRSFRLSDGKYLRTAVCSIGELGKWAERRATIDEYSILDFDGAERAEQESLSKPRR